MVKPFEKKLTIPQRFGTADVVIEALGYGNDKPSISLTQRITKNGREYTTSIGLSSEDFDRFYAYLTEAKEHWAAEG